MKLETFFDNFEMLADATNCVKKLRELILQLAMRGKLVPQDSNDEPTSGLLDKIKAEKERLIKEKKIKKNESLPPLKETDIPYQLPSSWTWISLGEIADYNGAAKVSPSEIPEDAWLLDLEDIEKDTSKIIQRTTISDRESKSTKAKFSEGDVLYGKLRPYLNKVVVADSDGFCTTEIVPLRIYYGISPKYLMYALKRPDFLEYVNSKTYGIKMPRLGTEDARRAPFPLAPLEEQRRIVAKIDQLMSLCDELEARQQKRRETRARLNSAALDRLLAARAPGEFAQCWQHIYDNFDLLYDAPENVGALRQAILQLAVMGKLVAQDTNDEPASVLLEKIKAEKEWLIKEKKIKKTETLVEPSEVPFELPKGWKWVSLGNALLKLTDGTHNSPPNCETGDFKYVTAKNIKTQGIDLTNITYVTTAIHNEIYSRCDPEPGDILYIKDGATTGIAAINDITEPFSMLSSVALLKTPSEIYNRYLLYVLRSPYFYSMMREDMSGVAITRVTLTKLNKAIIPLAPLDEQRRIVAKVNQLMSLCDALEASLTRSQADGERLMEAVVGRMLAG
ncbi:MAG: restriction endonuclease subunit S [Candidatus Methanoperedens sp.]|nr:restriction endonuclease subunit S [Candidatus Methanoperedens sp.]